MGTHSSNYDIQTMPNEIKAWGLGAQISIPAIPTSFFPGLRPISALMAASGSANNNGGGSTPTTTSLKPTSTTTQGSGGSSGTQSQYGQCGGSGYSGPTACAAPYACSTLNAYYSQCL